MPYLLPAAMLFGFLSMFVTRGDDFSLTMPLVLLLLTAWSVLAFLRDATRTRLVPFFTLAAVGFGVIALFARTNVVTYTALGPQAFGVPVVLLVLWVSTVFASAAIAVRLQVRTMLGVCVAGLIAGAWSLVVDTAGAHLVVFTYHAGLRFAEMSLPHTLWWTVTAACGALVLRLFYGWREHLAPLLAGGGALLVLGYATGVCIAVGTWVPAVVGLVLVQLGFRALYYL